MFQAIPNLCCLIECLLLVLGSLMPKSFWTCGRYGEWSSYLLLFGANMRMTAHSDKFSARTLNDASFLLVWQRLLKSA